MLKRYWLLVWLLFAVDCSASIWGSVSRCITDPCNCEQSKRSETWPVGGNKKTFYGNNLCPPWNKDGGRDAGNCLLQFDYPGKFIWFYLTHCAEKTSESTYFSPKIRIRTQSCNSASCWTQSTTLNWNGDCIIWAGAYGLPLLRICARVAVPEIPPNPNVEGDTGSEGDPGYTAGKHLDFDGSTKDDETILGTDNQPIVFDPPKLCAYADPGLVNLVSASGAHFTDPFDWNPENQPLHLTNELHPITKMLVFLVEQMGASAKTLPEMLSAVMSSIGDSEIAGVPVLQSIFDGIGKILDIFQDAVIAVIEAFGSLNNAVDSYSFGCVSIPLGPYPPPYCPSIGAFPPTPYTQTICKIDPHGDGTTRVKSTSSSPCVVSNFDNNFINNSIRITLNNFVPICKNGEDPTKTDKCVLFKNIDMASASTLHATTAYRDLIKPCSSVSGNTPCVNTKIIPSNCKDATGLWCGEGFRLVYSSETGDVSTPRGYFYSDFPDCSGLTSTENINCQKIWGINSEVFVDVNLKFPQSENSSNKSELAKTNISINDLTGKSRTFSASIVMASTAKSNLNFTQEPNQICAIEGNSVVGCEIREAPTNPIVFDCKAPNKAGLSCNNDYFTPKFIAMLETGKDFTGVIVEPLSIHNPSSASATAPTVVNLAGYSFSSFITDDTYIIKPFPSQPPLNPASIYGKYKNGAAPFDQNGNPTNAVYLYGLEYLNDKYIQGGMYACLEPLSMQHCPTEATNCVLTNLLNKDIVNCSDFINQRNQYPNLRLCQSTDTGCSKVDTVPAKSASGSGVTINKCNNNVYCYTNNQNIEVCVTSSQPSDRYWPIPAAGQTFGAPRECYDPKIYQSYADSSSSSEVSAALSSSTSSSVSAAPCNSDPSVLQWGSDYDQNLYALRDKTAVEWGFCVPITQPTCSAITTPGPNDGNATWPSTQIGKQAEGTCIAGYIPINPTVPLKRYCLLYVDTKSWGFDKLESGVGCIYADVTLASNTDNFPKDYPRSDPKNASATIDKKTGNVSLGTDSSHSLGQGSFYSKLTFNIPVVNNLEYFKLTTLGYDDYVLVKVNGKWAYSGQGDKGAVYFENFTSSMYSSDKKKWYLEKAAIDLKPYLQNGSNSISVEVVVVGKGGLLYSLDYKLKN